MRTLYLHIGTHKTGTTSIQQSLQRDADALSVQGIGVHREARAEGAFSCNAQRLAHCFVRGDLATPMRIRRPMANNGGILRRFQNDVRLSPFPTLVVSSETFCFLRTAEEATALGEVLGKLFTEVRPIVVFRNTRDWAASWAKQLDFMGVSETISQMAPDERVDGPWYFDRTALLRFWQQLGPVTQINYDTAVEKDGSIVPSFYQAIGAGEPSGLSPVFSNITNRRRGPKTRG